MLPTATSSSAASAGSDAFPDPDRDTDPDHAPDTVHDVIGVGFGPGNLALAVATTEHPEPVTARFLERQDRFGWHRGMLIPDARMQVSFIKDLASVRNPTSSYSFLNYLGEHGRLVDFLNRQTFFPTRLEYHDYLSWAAARMDHLVDYGTEVTGIRPAEPGGGPTLEVVAVRGGVPVRYLTRAVVVATGLVPHLPPGVRPTDRVWHNNDIVPRVRRLVAERGAEARRFVVVGAGQSAAESVEYLHRSFPGAEVHAVFDRWGYSPADDSAFANRVFDPDVAHDFHRSPPHVRERIVERHRNTNYSVVDPDLIQSLYERHYAERVAGSERLRFHPMSTIERVAEAADRVAVTVASGVDGSHTELDADVVVYATGYRSGDPARFLRDITAARDERGRVRISADYRLILDGTDAAVYVQGATEHTHGLASTLLSNVAVRSGEILHSVLAHRARVAAAPRPDVTTAAAT